MMSIIVFLVFSQIIALVLAAITVRLIFSMLERSEPALVSISVRPLPIEAPVFVAAAS